MTTLLLILSDILSDKTIKTDRMRQNKTFLCKKFKVIVSIMENSASVTDVIIWASPLVGGLALYLFHDAYSSLKGDIKDLRDRQAKTRDDISDVKADVRVVNDSLTIVSRNIDAAVVTVKDIDKRSGDTREMQMFMRTLENKMTNSEANYGKVILILKRVVAILRPNKLQPPQE